MHRIREARVVLLAAILELATGGPAAGAPGGGTRAAGAPVADALPASAPAADRIDRLTRALAKERSFKVRVQAASLLGKLRDRRAVPALVQALGDENHVVRAVVADALGKIRDPSSRPALARAASGDRKELVRRRAAAAVKAIDATASASSAPASARAASKPLAAAGPPATAAGRAGARPGDPVPVTVGRMGDRTGRAGAALRDRMRESLTTALRRTPNTDLRPETGTDMTVRVVDGAIKRLVVATGADTVEVTVEVELVLSGPRGVVAMTTGEATVQVSRHRFRPQRQEQIEAEAVDHAVAAATENLARTFAGR